MYASREYLSEPIAIPQYRMAKKYLDKVPPSPILDELEMTELLSRDLLTAARGIVATQFKPIRQYSIRAWTPARGSKDVQFWRRTYVRALFAFGSHWLGVRSMDS